MNYYLDLSLKEQVMLIDGREIETPRKRPGLRRMFGSIPILLSADTSASTDTNLSAGAWLTST